MPELSKTIRALKSDDKAKKIEKYAQHKIINPQYLRSNKLFHFKEQFSTLTTLFYLAD
jgi:hypothetical protein